VVGFDVLGDAWEVQVRLPRAANSPLPNIADRQRGGDMKNTLHRLWLQEEGQDIAEYAVMLAVILVIVVGTVRLIGSNANTVFSNVASAVQ
jgi:Flp pilus assembly pilin Flp